MTPAYLELHSAIVTARIKLRRCLLVYRAAVGHAPQYIADLLTPVSEMSAQCAHLNSWRFRYSEKKTRKIGERAFFAVTPKPHVRNQLSTELTLCRSRVLFKRKLTTLLFSSANGVSGTTTLELYVSCVLGQRVLYGA